MANLSDEQKIHSTIPEFFKGKVIFITGGTGFMGKVLIEKLLWSCPEIDAIYLLIRSKKGVDKQQRLIELEKNMIFERLRKRDPNLFLQKMKAINGDVSELNMGMSSEDQQLLIDSVSIIYHAAASIRFNDPLKDALILNTRGTREMMLFARKIKNLKCFLHVSTSFCNSDRDVIEEKIYPPHADWKTTIKVAETVDSKIINPLTRKYLNKLHNTYSFTKSLSEHVVNDLKGNFTTIIFRPSVVVGSVSEPFPGWIDNFYGPFSMLVASGKGLLRSMYLDKDCKNDTVPVDFSIKGMIIATWKYTLLESKPSDSVHVINSTMSNVNCFTPKVLSLLGENYFERIPFNNILWKPNCVVTNYKIIFAINHMLFHLLPSVMLDTCLKLLRKEPIFMKLSRRLYFGIISVRYYNSQEWLFKNDKFVALSESLMNEDVEDFSYNIENIDINSYFTNQMLGLRRYLLKESDETLPQAHIHFRRMKRLDFFVKAIFSCIIFWFLFSSTAVKHYLNKISNLY